MATVKLYLDERKTKGEDPSPLKIAIRHKEMSVFIRLDIKLLHSQWNVTLQKVVNHDNKLFLNNYIARRMLDVETALLKLKESNKLNGMKPADVKECVLAEISPEEPKPNSKNNFIARFKKFTSNKTNPRTNEIYNVTLNHILKYCNDDETLKFENITKDWLFGFDVYLAKTSPSINARNIHLRNIRAVFNDAIDDEITTFYPFRKFKIKSVATAKRSLSVEQLREFFNCKIEESKTKYRDIFKLIFLLIGINIIDLCNLKSIKSGRIEYYRSKTKRLYSIKVEPEAIEIIEKYKGKDYLLNIMDMYKNHKDFAHRLNENLQKIGQTETGKHGKKTHHPMFPDITTYWARHTWATIASELDIPKETIAAALGHGSNSVTDIYINFNQRKIDEANRKVIDYVLYDKK